MDILSFYNLSAGPWCKEELEHGSEATEEMKVFCTGKMTETTCVSVIVGSL